MSTKRLSLFLALCVAFALAGCADAPFTDAPAAESTASAPASLSSAISGPNSLQEGCPLVYTFFSIDARAEGVWTGLALDGSVYLLSSSYSPSTGKSIAFFEGGLPGSAAVGWQPGPGAAMVYKSVRVTPNPSGICLH